jgi:hypothetical protein
MLAGGGRDLRRALERRNKEVRTRMTSEPPSRLPEFSLRVAAFALVGLLSTVVLVQTVLGWFGIG